MKTLLSVGFLVISFNAFSQVGAPASGIDPTTNPSGVGFGAGTPGNTVTPPVTIPSPGAVPGSYGTSPATTTPDVTTPSRGNEFPQQQMQDNTPDLPSTNFPSTTPSFPNTTPSVPNTQDAFPGATNPAGTGVIPGPTGSPTVGP